MKRWIQIVAAALLLCLGSPVCLAEKLDLDDADFHFVDARGDAGYYVDMRSVAFTGDQLVTARVEIVRADTNRLYLYQMRFNRRKRLYQILSSAVAEYSTKEKMGGSGVIGKETGYSIGSPMEAVVEYIFSPTP